jgi:hypothetical protein
MPCFCFYDCVVSVFCMLRDSHVYHSWPKRHGLFILFLTLENQDLIDEVIRKVENCESKFIKTHSKNESSSD